jgi:hypothetical protein
VEAAEREANRPLSVDEFAAFLASECSPEAMDEKRALVAWFTRRYPTPAARLAYNRRYIASVRLLRRPRP